MRNAVLVLLCSLLLLMSGIARAENLAAGTAVQRLTAILKASEKVNTLQIDFVCSKHLQVLKRPFISGGRLFIARPNLVRFSTLWPYRSDWIVRNATVWSRAQGDKHWQQSSTSQRPGLGRMMMELANWSLGRTRALKSEYRVSERHGKAAALPAASEKGARRAAATQPSSVLDIFKLTPRAKSERQVLSSLSLAFEPKTHRLYYIKISTAGGDITRYWFWRVEINVVLGRNIFAPSGTR